MAATKHKVEAQNPLILRCNRLMEAFSKSDDERDFYLDRMEGFIIYVDLDKPSDELAILEKELEKNKERYCMIPKLTFYETKKIMEGFINEKVYDIDTKEKLLDIIQSKEARENFLEFIYDHHSELEKWQAFYQERSRIRIIEWLRVNNFTFVFEEDLEFPKLLLEKVKKELFQTRASKDVLAARKTLVTKSKTYYSSEALNPRPKRGRPPKQAQKAEIEPQISTDIYTTVPNGLRGFLFTPDLSGSTATFSSKFGYEEDLFSNKHAVSNDLSMENLNQKLAAIRSLSTKWKESEEAKKKSIPVPQKFAETEIDFDEDDEDEGFEEKPARVKIAQNSAKIVKKPMAKPTKIMPKKKPEKMAPIKKKPKPVSARPIPKKTQKKPAPNFKKVKTLRPMKKLKKKK